MNSLKRFISGVLVGLSLSGRSTPLTAPATNGDSPRIVATLEFNPGPTIVDECKSAPPDTFEFYTNKTGRAVRLAALDLWLGLYKGAIYDAAVVVDIRHGRDSMRIATMRWDRYADPNGLHQRYIALPYPVDIRPGGEIVIYAKKCWIEGTKSPLHPIVDFYFLDKP